MVRSCPDIVLLALFIDFPDTLRLSQILSQQFFWISVIPSVCIHVISFNFRKYGYRYRL